MKKIIFSFLFFIFTGANAGVWAPSSGSSSGSGSGSGNGGSCYLVIFPFYNGNNGTMAGSSELMGTGVPSSGTPTTIPSFTSFIPVSGTFTGFVKVAANPVVVQNSSNGSAASSTNFRECGNDGYCAYIYATGSSPQTAGPMSVVSVFNMPVYSASPIACY